MSTLSDLAGAVAGGAAGANPVSVIGGLVDDVFNAVFPSPEAKASAEAVAIKTQMDAYVAKATVDMAPFLAQADVDKVEASNASMFVAGWRPFIGWVCGAGFAYTFVVQPLATFGAHLAGWDGVAPSLDASTLMALTTGMLGMAGIHSYDKVQGTDTKVIGGTSEMPTSLLPANGKTALPWLKK